MTDRTPAVFASQLSQFPRLGLAQLDTPLEPLRRLSAHLGGPRLWVKREDATGLGFGGNKLSKLDYVLHDAVSSVADTLVSGGVVPHAATVEAIRLAGRLEALPVDPVYSGKGLAGLIALVREGRWSADDDVIFIHTGGSPALFAYQSSLDI